MRFILLLVLLFLPFPNLQADKMMKCEPMEHVQPSTVDVTTNGSIKKEVLDGLKLEKIKFDESYMPVAGLELQSEEDGYRYYADPKTQEQYSLDEAGFWYLWDAASGVFNPVPDASTNPTNQAGKTVAKVLTSNNTIVSVFPTNEKGQPILPRDANDQPYFPLDDKGNPVFPYDLKKKQWTFPVDDTEEPIFPRNAANKPIVPEDDRGRPIFPVDKKGIYIFPLDEHNCPTPAISLTSQLPVVPKDEYGSFVIPRDREGKALIHIAPDGLTPMSVSEFKYYKQYYKEHARNFYQTQQVQTPTAYPIRSMFHPLNLNNNDAKSYERDIEMLQRSKRVRPEDIDLPMFSTVSQDSNTPMMDGIKMDVGEGNASQKTKEIDKLLKRKKFLSAQLNFTKKLGVTVKKSSNGQKEGENKPNDSSKPVSTQELIEAVKKSIGSKKAELKAQVVEKHKSVDQKKISSKRKRSQSGSSHSSASHSSQHKHKSYNDNKKSGHSSHRKEQKGRSESFSSELEKHRDQISRKVISAIFGSEEYDPREYGPVEFKAKPATCELPSSYKPKSPPRRTESSASTTRSKSYSVEIDELNENSELDSVRKCIRQTRKKYDSVKKEISMLEKEKSVHKRNLIKLIELEKKIEEKEGDEYLSSSTSSSSSSSSSGSSDED